MEDPQGRSGLPTGVYGMLTSDHDTEKTSGEKYQGASQGGVGVVNVQMNEFSEGTFTCPSENLFICTCIFLEASTL